MKLRTKYILFVVIVHAVTLTLSFYVFRDNKVLFIASEALILFSVYISWRLYRGLLSPLRALREGIEAIRSRDFNVKFVQTGKREMDELVQVYNTMIDELRVERTKQEEQHFFLEKLIHTSPMGILILDFDGLVQQLNPQARQLLGVEEGAVLGKPAQEIPHALMQEVSKLGSGESRLMSLNGVETYKVQKSHFMDRGFPRYFILVEELTAEMLAAEKKAYGKVIRMMAHEVNNTVGPVNSILQSTLAAAQKSEAINHALQVAIDRNNNLNHFMRNFADVVRLPEPQRRSVNVQELVQSIGRLMELKAGEKKITFHYKLLSEALLIEADPLQLEQALINIVKNGIEAISEEGIIDFITTRTPRSLIIRDSGKGIEAGLADQLFSPFFSTKKDGQGIGLTLTREILLNHGFDFTLRTVSPGNTEFRIVFDQV